MLFEIQTLRRTHGLGVYIPPAPLLLTRLKASWGELVAAEATHQVELRARATRIQQAHNVLSSFVRKADLQHEWAAACLELVQQTAVGESVGQCQRALQRQQALEADCIARSARLAQLGTVVALLQSDQLPGVRLAEERLTQLETQWQGLMAAVRQRHRTLTALLLVETVLAASEECNTDMATAGAKLHTWLSTVELQQQSLQKTSVQREPVMLGAGRSSHEASQADLGVVRLAPLTTALEDCQASVLQLENQIASGLEQLGNAEEGAVSEHPMAATLHAELNDRQTQLQHLEQQFETCKRTQAAMAALNEVDTQLQQTRTAIYSTGRLLNEQTANLQKAELHPAHLTITAFKRLHTLLGQQQTVLAEAETELHTHTTLAIRGWVSTLLSSVRALSDSVAVQQRTLNVLQSYHSQQQGVAKHTERLTQVATQVVAASSELAGLGEASPVRVSALGQHLNSLAAQLRALAPECEQPADTRWLGVPAPLEMLTDDEWDGLQAAQTQQYAARQQQLADAQAHVEALQQELTDHQLRQAHRSQQEALTHELAALRALVQRRERKLLEQGATLPAPPSPHTHNPTSAIVTSPQRHRDGASDMASPPPIMAASVRVKQLSQTSPPTSRPASPHAGLRQRILAETAILANGARADLQQQKQTLLARVAGLDALEAELAAAHHWHAQLEGVMRGVQVHAHALTSGLEVLQGLSPNVATAQINARLAQLTTQQNQVQSLQASGDKLAQEYPGQGPRVQGALAETRALLARTQADANTQARQLACLQQQQPHTATLLLCEQQLAELATRLETMAIPKTEATTSPQTYALLAQDLTRQRTAAGEHLTVAERSAAGLRQSPADHHLAKANVQAGNTCLESIRAAQPALVKQLDGLAALVTLAVRQQQVHMRLAAIEVATGEQQQQLSEWSLPATVDDTLKQQQGVQLLLRAVLQLQQELQLVQGEQDTLNTRVASLSSQLDPSAHDVLVEPSFTAVQATMAQLQTDCAVRQRILQQRLAALRLQDELADARLSVTERQHALDALREQPLTSDHAQRQHAKALAQLQLDVTLQAEADRHLRTSLDDVMAEVDEAETNRSSPDTGTLEQALTAVVAARQGLQSELAEHQAFVAAAVRQQQQQRRWEAVEVELLALEEQVNRNALDAGLTTSALEEKKKALYRCELQLDSVQARMHDLQADEVAGSAELAFDNNSSMHARLSSLADTLAQSLRQEKEALAQWRCYLLWQEQAHSLLVWCTQCHREAQALLATQLREYQPLRKQRQYDLWCFAVQAKESLAASLQAEAKALTVHEHLMLHLSDLFELSGRLDQTWQATLGFKGDLTGLFDALASMQAAMLGLDEILVALEGVKVSRWPACDEGCA